MKIGILVGMENTFPPALIEKINSMDAGVTAEYVKVGGLRMDAPNEYRVILDRISHEIPFYRAYLKHAVLNGAVVVNNPFWWSADEKFFGYSLATRLGLAVPKTILLPQKNYKQGVTDASLRNLEFPLDWEGIIAHVGLPAILKPHDGGGWKDVYKVDTLEELWRDYDRTGTLAMTLQEFIDFKEYVRCYCVGRREVLVMPYDPKQRRYLPRAEQPLPPELEDRIVRETMLINEALGYDLNTVEFAVRDGIPYAIDFTNPAPDADIWSVTEPYHRWVVDAVARMLVDYAKHGPPPTHHRWYKWLNPESGEQPAAGAAGTSSQADAQNFVAGVEQMAQNASAVLTDLLDEMSRPVKPKRSRKAAARAEAKADKPVPSVPKLKAAAAGTGSKK